MKWMFRTVAVATMALAMTSCDELAGIFDDPVIPPTEDTTTPETPEVPAATVKTLTKISRLEKGDDTPEVLTLAYDDSKRVKEVKYDGQVYTYTYGSDKIDVKWTDEEDGPQTLTYTLSGGKVTKSTRDDRVTTYTYNGNKLSEVKDEISAYSFTWTNDAITKFSYIDEWGTDDESKREYEVTAGTTEADAVTVAIFLLSGGSFGFPLDVDDLRRTAPIIDKLGDMPKTLPSKVAWTDGDDSSTYTAAYTKDANGYLTTVTIDETFKHVDRNTNQTETEITSYTYTLTWE